MMVNPAKPSEPTLDDVCLSLHTAFRKAADSDEAWDAWKAIKKMDDKEWGIIVQTGLSWVGIEVSNDDT